MVSVMATRQNVNTNRPKQNRKRAIVYIDQKTHIFCNNQRDCVGSPGLKTYSMWGGSHTGTFVRRATTVVVMLMKKKRKEKKGQKRTRKNLEIQYVEFVRRAALMLTNIYVKMPGIYEEEKKKVKQSYVELLILIVDSQDSSEAKGPHKPTRALLITYTCLYRDIRNPKCFGL